MLQDELNKTRIDEWYNEGIYDEKFRLKLTSKHALVVGRWDYKGEWGVDLRKWSYDQSRLLGVGIAINSSTWELLYRLIIRLHENGYFSKYTELIKNELQETIKVDDTFVIITDMFEGANKRFFCITLFDKLKKRVWKGRYAHVGIMIRFDTIHDFILQCRGNALIKQTDLPKETKRQIDKKTGREIF